MSKFIVAALGAVSLLALSAPLAPASAGYYTYQYHPSCYWVWTGYRWAAVCY
jgi:hypothetical protein